jgi:methylated-DNA-protein-cysteine methyltransferase-like protein
MSLPSRTDFATGVFRIVSRIPRGRVTTYGDIARALGRPRGARQVGWILYAAPRGLELPFHRVIDRDGYLSAGWHFGHPRRMKQLLIDEGVPFSGEYTVNLDRCRWFPDGSD